MNIEKKLSILTDGAKYDVSCSSSGSNRSAKKNMLGMPTNSGICHSFTSDGRCISLLKILMTNKCIYDCKYCINRSSSNVERAIFTPEELCNIFISFYKRNYVEGLFLSSAVFKSPDYTMELLVNTATLLRYKYKFNGYIHLKGIPSCSKELNELAAKVADRVSYNIELPSKTSLKLLAPEKKSIEIVRPMQQLSNIYIAQKNGEYGKSKVLPAGQTTQMIVGATKDTDSKILHLTERLYEGLNMKRVYFSAYVPIVKSNLLPNELPNLLRENRLYQADWLLRFYGFTANEIIPQDSNLSTDIDPKSAWALRNLDLFPIEINTATYRNLLRVPGIGITSANKIIQARKYHTLRYEDLIKMKIVIRRAVHFILCNGKYYGTKYNENDIHNQLIMPSFINQNPDQLSLFDSNQNDDPQIQKKYTDNIIFPATSLLPSVITGQL